jgi:hypothetical protein
MRHSSGEASIEPPLRACAQIGRENGAAVGLVIQDEYMPRRPRMANEWWLGDRFGDEELLRVDRGVASLGLPDCVLQ